MWSGKGCKSSSSRSINDTMALGPTHSRNQFSYPWHSSWRVSIPGIPQCKGHAERHPGVDRLCLWVPWWLRVVPCAQQFLKSVEIADVQESGLRPASEFSSSLKFVFLISNLSAKFWVNQTHLFMEHYYHWLLPDLSLVLSIYIFYFIWILYSQSSFCHRQLF